MDDIIDDGLPPDERAGMHRTLHVMLSVVVDNMKHLPKMNLDGVCTPYVVIRYYDELFQTAHKDGVQSVHFAETFDFFVHAKERQEAVESNSIRHIGPRLQVECWNWHRIASATLIGSVEVPLKDIFAHTYPLQMTYQIHDSDGLAVRDKNDDVTTLTLTYSARELQSDEPEWQAPSLIDTLNCSEGKNSKCSLRRGYRSRAASSVPPTKEASRGSMSTDTDRYSTDRNSDVYGASSALQVQDLADSEETMAGLIRSIRDSKEDVYWRERLNTVMESLWVNLTIMVLVVLDCSSLIYFIVANADDVTSSGGLDGVCADVLCARASAPHACAAVALLEEPLESLRHASYPPLCHSSAHKVHHGQILIRERY